jgi:hypothetical protein
MIVRGIDFTSAPKRRKPILCADARLDGDRLRVLALRTLTDFAAFEALLAEPGPWVAGCDFPFAQPRRLAAALGWPTEWETMIRHVATLGRGGFQDALVRYKHPRPAGDREHRRATDAVVGAISPQKLFGVPVAKMFFEGATRLAATPLNIVPMRPTADSRTVVEAYPALLARRVIGRTGYKGDGARHRTPERRLARKRILAGLSDPAAIGAYGLRVDLDGAVSRDAVDDAAGDCLDAVLCAVQAAWAFRHDDWGVPAAADRLEGWIVDPGALERPEGKAA